MKNITHQKDLVQYGYYLVPSRCCDLSGFTITSWQTPFFYCHGCEKQISFQEALIIAELKIP